MKFPYTVYLDLLVLTFCSLVLSSFCMLHHSREGFLQSSVGEESTCNAGNPSSIPGQGGSPGEGRRCPLQYSWASLVAQLVKNPPVMQETWDQPGLERPPGERKGYQRQYSGWENALDRMVHGVTELDTTE